MILFFLIRYALQNMKFDFIPGPNVELHSKVTITTLHNIKTKVHKVHTIVVKHPTPLPLCTCAVSIHKTCIDLQQNGYRNRALIQDHRSMCWQHTKHFDLRQFIDRHEVHLSQSGQLISQNQCIPSYFKQVTVNQHGCNLASQV